MIRHPRHVGGLVFLAVLILAAVAGLAMAAWQLLLQGREAGGDYLGHQPSGPGAAGAGGSLGVMMNGILGETTWIGPMKFCSGLQI